jgi:DNA invertase Pin-like site-specific DNA recombinase
LGVKRQERECRELCRRLGLTVAAVFVDDDRSAFSGKPRPGYLAMLERLELGDFGVIVAWHPDRLQRSPVELESFIDLLDRTRTTVVTVQGGDYDLSTASGRMTARVVGAVARHESEHKSERLRAKMRELVEAGKMTGGSGHRAYGYDAYEAGSHELVVREDEAEVVRELVDRYLAGESLAGLCRDLNRRGVPTAMGGRWKFPTLRGLLVSSRIAGLREHDGKLVPAPWPAIIDADQHHRVLARVRANAHAGRRAARRFLLTGIARCGREGCGAPLVGRTIMGSRTKRFEPRYVCARERGGCSGISVLAVPVEERTEEVIFEAMESPELRRRLTHNGHQPSDLHDELESIERRMAELARDWADGQITHGEWQVARKRLNDRQAEIRTQIGRRDDEEAQDGVLARWADGERSLRDDWPMLSIDQKRAIAARVLGRVVIAPFDSHAPRRFDSRRVVIERRI